MRKRILAVQTFSFMTLIAAGCGGPGRFVIPAALNAPTFVQIDAGLEYVQRDGRPLRFDLYRPIGPPFADTLLPVVIIVHGGSWQSGSRDGSIADFAFDIAAQGYAAASITYRLADGETTFPAPVADVLAAVRHFKERGPEYGADPDRIALFGQSAGAHLALLAGLTDDASVFDPDRPAGESPGVRAIVNLFGPTDLTADASIVDAERRADVERFLGFTIDEASMELRRAASPISYVRGDGPAVLTIHGDADSTVPVSQARALVAALNAAGQQYVYLEIPEMDHVPGAIWIGSFAQSYRHDIFAFLDDALAQASSTP